MYALLAVLTAALFIAQFMAIDALIDHAALKHRRIIETHRTTSRWRQMVRDWEFGAWLRVRYDGWSPSIRAPGWRPALFTGSEIIAEVY